MSSVQRTSGQHHGDLRNALLDAAHDLVRQGGLANLTMARASRAAGVSTAAPYKHFADREALLAAVAARGFLNQAAWLRLAMGAIDGDVERLAGFSREYVLWAGRDRAMFEIAYQSRRDKHAYPELTEATGVLFDLLLEPAGRLVPAARAAGLVVAIGALAHGYAVFLLEEAFGPVPDACRSASAQAEKATRTLLAGEAGAGS